MNEEREHHPNSIVKDMYLEITNISQGVNIAILVYVISSRNFFESTFETWLLTLTSFLVVIIFWIRYYFDTEILKRSFTILSVVWFFAYEVVQGISISFVNNPALWFLMTGIFLFMGGGFYWINLHELHRKEQAGVLKVKSQFAKWQKQRMLELVVLAVLSVGVGLLLLNYSIPNGWIYMLSCVALGIAVWQTVVTNDYRIEDFIDVGF